MRVSQCMALQTFHVIPQPKGTDTQKKFLAKTFTVCCVYQNFAAMPSLALV